MRGNVPHWNPSLDAPVIFLEPVSEFDSPSVLWSDGEKAGSDGEKDG
jgi:hypothetical protein